MIVSYILVVILLTRGSLGHVLDTGIRCFGAIRVGIKWSSPVKARFQSWIYFHKH